MYLVYIIDQIYSYLINLKCELFLIKKTGWSNNFECLATCLVGGFCHLNVQPFLIVYFVLCTFGVLL
jgi:hypothetical protein